MSFAPAHRYHKGLVLCSTLSIGLLAACTTEAEPTGAFSGASLDSPGVEQTSDVQAQGTAADAESAAPEEAGTTEPASATEDDVIYAEVDDPDGDEAEEYNQQLSEDRAQAVADWMEDHADVHYSDLTVEGYGMDHPRADNSTEEGRAENRRVVITVEEI